MFLTLNRERFALDLTNRRNPGAADCCGCARRMGRRDRADERHWQRRDAPASGPFPHMHQLHQCGGTPRRMSRLALGLPRARPPQFGQPRMAGQRYLPDRRVGPRYWTGCCFVAHRFSPGCFSIIGMGINASLLLWELVSGLRPALSARAVLLATLPCLLIGIILVPIGFEDLGMGCMSLDSAHCGLPCIDSRAAMGQFALCAPYTAGCVCR